MDRVSILDKISEHLADNQVCVVIEIGAEKARYLSGQAIAVSWTGERIDLDINHIYGLAQDEFGGDAEITQATY